MIKKIIYLWVALIMGLGLFAGCGGNPTEQAQSGAYFATGNGVEYAVIYDNYLSLYWDSNNNRFDVFPFHGMGIPMWAKMYVLKYRLKYQVII